MIFTRHGRQYARDVRIETVRPHAPRNLQYDSESLELTWTGPAGGPAYTHFNLRMGNDKAAPSYTLPKGTSRHVIPYATLVTLTCWNETVRTESDAARILVGPVEVEWEDATSVFGTLRGYQVEYDLEDIGSSIVINSPVTPRPNQRLLIYVNQDPVTQYGLAFNPATFVDSAAQFIDPAMAWVREWAGRSDAKWHPITIALQYDPNA